MHDEIALRSKGFGKPISKTMVLGGQGQQRRGAGKAGSETSYLRCKSLRTITVIAVAIVWRGLSLGAFFLKETLGEVVPSSPGRAKPKIGQIPRKSLRRVPFNRTKSPSLPRYNAVLPSFDLFCADVEACAACSKIHDLRSCHREDRPRTSNHCKSRIPETPARPNERGMVVEH